MSRRSGAKGHRDRTGSVFQLPDHGSGSDCGGVPQHSLLSSQGLARVTDRISDFDLCLGARLRKLRLQRGLTLPDVAGEIDVSYQQLQKYEAGRNSLSVARFVIVAEILEMAPEEILNLDLPIEAARESSAHVTEEGRRLLKAYFSLSAPKRLALLRLIVSV